MEALKDMIEESKEIFKKIDALDEDTRKHLARSVLYVLKCYTDPDSMGVLLYVRKDRNTPNAYIGMNCDEMESVGMVEAAHEVMMHHHMSEKETAGPVQ